ncbi:MAG: ABC transporter substrate-binding protein [Candidatus Binatia bacterium]
MTGSDNLKSKNGTADEMRHRRLKWPGWLAILLLLAGWVRMAGAQQESKVIKIGWLGVRPNARETASTRGSDLIWRNLRALGYVEGKNIAIEYLSTDGKLDRISAVADELVRLKVDVLVASATLATIALTNTTKTIPIVFLTTADPVTAGQVDSLARPGGNLTGFTTFGTELAGKRLELLKETIPSLSRAAVLWNPREPGNAQVWKESQFRHGNWAYSFIPWR